LRFLAAKLLAALPKASLDHGENAHVVVTHALGPLAT